MAAGVFVFVKNYIWQCLFCFWFKTWGVAPKFIENDFWKIVSTSYRIGRIFGKGSVAELWGNGAYVGGI